MGRKESAVMLGFVIQPGLLGRAFVVFLIRHSPITSEQPTPRLLQRKNFNGHFHHSS